jgi:predicted 3-demethylubiquinone-9 3-methyltransferase (glyoxalase superfamily)
MIRETGPGRGYDRIMKHITPCLWFDDNAEEAVNFYCSVFKDSGGRGGAKIKAVSHYGETTTPSNKPKGSVLTILFEIHGQEYMALNGGPMFEFTEAISLMVMCDDQKEVDRYWNALSGPGSGGEESMCGWLKDKYGLSWQIVPAGFERMLYDKDPKKSDRVMAALLKMRKIDLATLQKAYEGK